MSSASDQTHTLPPAKDLICKNAELKCLKTDGPLFYILFGYIIREFHLVADCE